jgi:hypothetical protein
MKTKLAINTGFAVNRFTPPEQWIPLIKHELEIDYVQVTADMFMPFLMDPLCERIAERTRTIADKNNLTIDSVFTGGFTRLNHFSHPDADVRDYWLKWFRRFVDVSTILGASSLGSHFGIQTVPDCQNSGIRKKILECTVACWRQIDEYAMNAGLAYLTWEPMSIAREYGQTIDDTIEIQARLQDFPLPMLLCLDVDHGDVESDCGDDTDPYKWLERFGNITPLVHLKQSHKDKSGHWPFSSEHNEQGKIVPSKILESLDKGGAKDVVLILELSFRERSPAERRMMVDLKESVSFWKRYCKS